MILNLARMDFKKRYLGTMLGALWALLSPLVTIVLIYFVMTYGLKAGAMGSASFADWLIAGMLAWFFISECLVSAPTLIVEYSYLVTKMRFPVGLLLPARLCAAIPIHFFLVCGFLLLLIFQGKGPTLCWLQLGYYFFCSCVLVFSINMLTSAVGVFIRDTSSIIGVLLQIFFWVTPLFWNPELLQWTPFSFLLKSPFTYIVTGYRDSIFDGVLFWQRPIESLVFWLTTATLFVGGRFVFRRSRPHFADVF